MIRIAVCDKEKLWRDFINETILSNYNGLDFVVDEYDTGKKLADAYKAHKIYDLVVLEPNSCDVNVEDFLFHITSIERSPLIIIVTHSSSYIHLAFRIRVFQYLLKSIAKSELKKDILRAFSTLRKKKRMLSFVKSGHRYVINVSDIAYAESENHHIILHTNAKDIVCYDSLTSLYNRLKNVGFIKCNQSYIVNSEYIISLEKNLVMLRNGAKIYLSRGCKKIFYEKYTQISSKECEII